MANARNGVANGLALSSGELTFGAAVGGGSGTLPPQRLWWSFGSCAAGLGERVIEASGILAAGESTAAMAYVKARRGVSPRQTKVILVVCMLAVGLPLGAWASGSWLTAMMSVEFAIGGLVLGALIVQGVAGPAMRKALAERGQNHEHALTLRLTPEAVVYDLADLTMTAGWPCVTDLYRTGKYWVFLVQSSAMVLPRRFFATPEAEREFIAEAMSRMTGAARARSPDAVRIVGV